MSEGTGPTLLAGRRTGQPDRVDAPVGTLLACVVPHCDPTVNLYDRYHCVRGDRLVEVWPIEARGRSD